MSDIISFLSGGIIGGFLGAFLGGFAKFFWGNWLPSELTWRRQQKVERAKFLSRFRDPAMRATTDLQGRVYSILMSNNIEYLKRHKREDYFIKSTSFLVAQFFAWAEILRRKAAMLDYGELVTRIKAVTMAFTSGVPGFQIFGLEQREIGERMIVVQSNRIDDYHCLGYAEFLELMAKGVPKTPTCFQMLEKHVRALMVDLPKERLIRVQHALIDLMDFIDPEDRWVPRERRTKVSVAKPRTKRHARH